MAIAVVCPACKEAFKVRDEYAGKRGKCVRCQAKITIPSPIIELGDEHSEPEDVGTYELGGATPRVSAIPVYGIGGTHAVSGHLAKAVESTRRTQTPAKILAAFQDYIEPVTPTAFYRLCILVVAAFMILLPVAYLAIIGLVGFAVWQHAVHNIELFTRVKNTKAALLLYLAPLAAGLVVLIFMLKPLFARPGRSSMGRTLDPSSDPLLFAFVDGVCETVGAKTPARIEVNCTVNAAAYQASGAFSIFKSELVLIIGLPLVAGLNLQQFAGVLAHEFGHFSQSAGMRVSGVVRSINAWFARVVYERDSWDEELAARTFNGDFYVMGFVILARVAVWLTRRVLWVLMVLGHAVSMFLTRQMEFDADRYEARMVGGDVFAQTALRLAQLGVASQGAYADVATSWNEKRLPDNLPKLIFANALQLPEAVREALRKAESEGRTRLFDSHPANRERVARARLEAAEGIFQLSGPATDLFHDFDDLARSVTIDEYRGMIGRQFSEDLLFPVAEVIHGQAAAQQGSDSFDRFFVRACGALQWLELPGAYPAASANLKAARKALIEARTEMEATRQQNLEARKRLETLNTQIAKARAAAILLKTGNRFKLSEYDVEGRTGEDAELAGSRAEAEGRRKLKACARFEAAAVRRLVLSLGILELDEAAGRVAEGTARREEARVLYPFAASLGANVMPELDALLRARQTLGLIIERINPRRSQQDQSLINAILRAANELHERLTSFHWKLSDSLFYPFEHSGQNVTIRSYALRIVPSKDAIGELAASTDDALAKTLRFYRRVLGRLVMTAEEVERALALPPIEVADDPAPDEQSS